MIDDDKHGNYYCAVTQRMSLIGRLDKNTHTISRV